MHVMAFARTQHRAVQAKGNRCSVAILSAVVDAKAFHEVRLSASFDAMEVCSLESLRFRA